MKDLLKENKAAVIIILVALVVVAWSFYSSYQIAVKECKELCFYQSRSGVWNYEYGGEYKNEEGFSVNQFVSQRVGRNFPKQEQCVDYCLSQN